MGKCAYMHILCILPYHTIFHIVLKGIIEEQLKVCANSLQGRIGTSIETLLYIIECDRILYDLVIVRIQLTRRLRLKNQGELASTGK